MDKKAVIAALVVIFVVASIMMLMPNTKEPGVRLSPSPSPGPSSGPSPGSPTATRAPPVSDIIIADVTVLSLGINDVCPSGNTCEVTNPKDSGEIRIDHIITYRHGDPAITPLSGVGTKAVTFAYSARSAIVRYGLPAGGEIVSPPPSGPVPVEPFDGTNSATEVTGPPGPEPLVPRENGSFVYTFYSTDPRGDVLLPIDLQVGDELELPGLVVGDKIRVYFSYSGPDSGPLEIREYVDAICTVEGDWFEAKFGGYCCEGLSKINATEPQEGGCALSEPPSVFFCANCSNDECGLGENVCNCPADCR